MDYIFKDWQEKLSKFESSVKKDLEEIRKCKAEMQQMKLEMANEQKGRFISDDERLILCPLPGGARFRQGLDRGGAWYAGRCAWNRRRRTGGHQGFQHQSDR